jgi:hypothetical protein
MNEELRAELERLRDEDQALRLKAMSVANEHGRESDVYQTFREEALAVEAKNLRRLVAILDEHGWPGVELVGEKAESGAFLLLQHADLATQRKYLPLLREATAAGDAPTTQLPLLEDRVRLREGKPQLYGSQIVPGEDGKPTVWPIEDEETVDERRATVGLEPLAEYVKRWGIVLP